jgi:hypothetical protein
MFNYRHCDSLHKISLQTFEIVRHDVNAVKHKSDDTYLSIPWLTRPFCSEQRRHALFVVTYEWAAVYI